MNRIAIIGSGITGLSIGFHQPKGQHITVFDKSRRPGGRVCSRTSRNYPEYSFDHGTPFINPEGEFKTILNKLNLVREVDLSVVKSLNDAQKQTKKFTIGNKAIQSIPLGLMKQLHNNHTISEIYNTRINQLFLKEQTKSENDDQDFWLRDQNGKAYGPYDKIYFCIPYPQARQIQQNIVNFAEQDKNDNPYICDWVIMLSIKNDDTPSTHAFLKTFSNIDICHTVGADIQYAVSQRDRGATSDQSLWVFTMKKQWSQSNRNLKPQEVEAIFIKQLSSIFNVGTINYNFIKSHRWLYAHPQKFNASPVIRKNLVFCGDWVNQQNDVQSCWNLGLKICQQEKKLHIQGSL